MKKNQRRYGICIKISRILLLLLLIIFIYYFHLQQKVIRDTATNQYEKEYVMITEENDSEFWTSVYKSALKEAEAQNAYVEWLGTHQSSSYTMKDYLKIAIASEVDGILIHPDGTKEVEELMLVASEAGIPVVTLVDDDANFKRISCVGLNAYQLGQLYADTILKLITSDTKKIEVLLDEKDMTSNDIIFNQITSTVRASLGEGAQIDISSQNVSGDNTFDSEEAVRNIFIDSGRLPDILICLSDVDSQAACQAVVDYNQVGNVSIIGYYTSETVLNAIQKKIIDGTIGLDTDQIGQKGVDALEEYRQTGYVSEYTSINLNLVTKDNITQYMGE